MRQFIDIAAILEGYTAEAPENRGIFKGRRFWSGAFDTRDGFIVEVHSYEQAVDNDFHHSFYFSLKAQDMMSEGLAAFFWIDAKGLQTEWRSSAAQPAIVASILAQIEIV